MQRGKWTLRLEELETRQMPSVISGVVFEDLNDNGSRDDGEPGRAGWEVQLYNTLGTLMQTTTTNADGTYSFTGLAPGKYVVQEIVQPGWRQTFPTDAAVRSFPRHDDHPHEPDPLPDDDCGCDGDPKKPKSTTKPSAETSGMAPGGPRGADLLPDLIVDTARGLSDWYIDGNKLRFSQATPNIGLGPLELRGGTVTGDRQEVIQRIRNSSGGTRDRVAGYFVFHPGHGHIHFEGYSQYNLRRALPDANGDGIPELGEIVATGGKVSFCLLDSQIYDRNLPNFSRNGRYFNCGQVQGLSVGWEDIYDADLEGQEIDITNLPPGKYFLEAIVDPDNAIEEVDETNNVGRVLISIPNTGRAGTYTVTLQADQEKPNIDFGNFTYVTIAGTVFADPNANGFHDDFEPGLAERVVYLDRNNNGVFDQGQIVVHSTDVPRNLPDEGAISSTLTVAGTGTIVDVNVQLSMAHTYIGDVRVYLISPQLTRVELIRNRGANGQSFTNTILDDETTQPIAAGTAPFTGRFKPESPLTKFDGQDADGIWTLELQDTSGTDVGTLLSWSLEITFEEPHVHTDSLGRFTFDRLGLGLHRVRQVVPVGWEGTTPDPEDFDADASGASLSGVRLGARDLPPQVVGVFLKPAKKVPVAIAVGSGVQLDPLLIGDIKRISITFSEPVKVKRSDLKLGNVKGFVYDSVTHTATWLMKRPLVSKLYELQLSDRVKDLTGMRLDGEWDNPTDVLDSVSSTFPSGDGQPGGAFIFRFEVGQLGTTARTAWSDAEIAAALFARTKA